MTKPNKKPHETYKRILNAFIALAKRNDYNQITRPEIAERAKVTESLVSHHLGSKNERIDLLMAVAIQRKILPILARGIVNGHPVAKSAPKDLVYRALTQCMD